MGDSTAMTIDFLRARLLSERSVSRSARQRADQLAKRVLELEEHIRIVTIQRKKAEKAAGEVLAILEAQGVNDFPEVIYSSSDRDHAPGESKGSNENAKGDETSSASRMDGSDVEDGMSGSEVEVNTPQGRSLSWKSRNNNSDSCEKRKEYQARRRQGRGLISRIGSSPQHTLGKSCRRIKSSRDMGSASEDGRSNATQVDHTSDCADDEAQLSKETCDIEQEKLEENILHPSEDQHGCSAVDLYTGFGRDEAMEEALQQQAQLIVQFQAEENAQREWEAKYNENNSSTLASCEQHAMLVNTAEDKDASVEGTKLADEAITSDKETKISNGDAGGQKVSDAHSREGAAATNSDGPAVTIRPASDMITSSADVGGSMDQQCHESSANEYGSGSQEFEFPGPSNSCAEACGVQCCEPFNGNADISSRCNSDVRLCGNACVESTSTESPSSSRSGGKFSKGPWSLIQSQTHQDLAEPPKDGSGNVLDALQRAKMSLRRELSKLQQPPMLPPQSAWSSTTDSPSLAIRSSDTLGIPFGSAGLFRLPTDVTLQVDLPRANYYDTGLGMPSLRSFAGFSDGYTLNARTGSRAAVTSAIKYSVPGGTGVPTFTGGYSYAATDLTARTSSYDRFPNSSYMGVKREMLPVADAHNTIYGADGSRLDIVGIQRLQE